MSDKHLQCKPQAPIGIFDSGVGGLSVARCIHRRLPAESLLYIADSRFAPYGELPLEQIHERSRRQVAELVEQGSKLVVVACNTATVASIAKLRAEFSVPIVGVEPGVKPALLRSASGVVGVLATSNTARSGALQSLVKRFAGEHKVVVQACPGLVEEVEAGNLDGLTLRRLIRRYLQPLLAQGVDHVVLGCTHYPWLAPLLAELLPQGVALLDTGEAIAREVERRLALLGLLAQGPVPELALDYRAPAPLVPALAERLGLTMSYQAT